MLVRTHARTILSFGAALGLAIACSDDSSGGDDDDDDPSSSGVTSNTINGNATITSAAIGMGTATSGSPTNMSATASTGTGTGTGTGSGGVGGSAGASGAGGACEPDPSSGLPTDGVDGVAGGGGAPSATYDDGFHFTDPESVASWRLKPVADCPTCIADATLEAGCGTMIMTANWPEAANEGTLTSTAELNAAGDERWDLSGQTVTVRLRWLSGGDVENNGFNVYLELLDDDYSFAGPPLGEWYDAGEGYAEWFAVVPSAPDGEFDPATVRQINVRIDTKFWVDDDPTFAYETSIFEIDAVVW